MTFSIVARCAQTGMFGLAVSSSSPAVAARCAFVEAGVGAVASQNVTDPTLGPKALALMRGGASAAEAVVILARREPHMAHRQLLAVDADGETGAHSGVKALGVWATAATENAVCAGNLLANPNVPQAMADAFAGADGPLADRLLGAMRAALAAGGEAGPVRSAGLLLARTEPWPVADLRVDWTEEGQDPIAALETLWRLYAPQLDDYVTRAKDPSAAPSYGVPGDD